MDLGLLITRLENEQDAGDALDALGDIVLYSEVLATGERFGESPAAYTAGAVARFAGGADDAAWTNLLGAMERAQQPSKAFLAHAIRWALLRDASEDREQSCCGSCGAEKVPEAGHGTTP
jgi:hypothetical protein